MYISSNSQAKQDREKKISRKDHSGMTEEEMIKCQEEMFAKARERLQSGVADQ